LQAAEHFAPEAVHSTVERDVGGMSSSSESQPQFVLLFGGPAAGKGTQASLLSEALGLPHISSGDLIRQNQSQSANTVMQRGDLLPDDVVSQIVFDRLTQPDTQHGAVLDGFPRDLGQARSLDRWIAEHGGAIRAAVFLEVPEEEMIKRLIERGEMSGRIDDRPQVAPRRLEVFLRDIPPVLNHYADRGLLHRIDGTQPVHEIHRQIVETLRARPFR
jgi:adenylate kinase